MWSFNGEDQMSKQYTLAEIDNPPTFFSPDHHHHHHHNREEDLMYDFHNISYEDNHNNNTIQFNPISENNNYDADDDEYSTVMAHQNDHHIMIKEQLLPLNEPQDHNYPNSHDHANNGGFNPPNQISNYTTSIHDHFQSQISTATATVAAPDHRLFWQKDLHQQQHPYINPLQYDDRIGNSNASLSMNLTYYDRHHYNYVQSMMNPCSRVCAHCKTRKTPLWRNGPHGPKSLCNACGIRFKKEERRNHTINSGPAPSLGVYSAGNDQNITNRYKHITDHHDINHLTINRSAHNANRLHSNHDYISINHEVNVGSFNHSTYHNNSNNNRHHHHNNVFSSSIHID